MILFSFVSGTVCTDYSIDVESKQAESESLEEIKDVTVMVNLNGGTLNGHTEYPINVKAGTEVTLQEPYFEGYNLVGYYCPSGKLRMSSSGKYKYIVGNEDTTIKALWGNKTSTPSPSESKSENKKVEFSTNTNHIVIGNGESFKISVKTKSRESQIFKSANIQVAEVDENGTVKGISEGLTHIDITLGGTTKRVNVVVKCEPFNVGVTSGMSSKKTIKLKKGKKSKIIVYFKEGCYSNKISFKSSSKKVTVSGTGTVTAKASGTAKITITTYNGKKAYVTVNVPKAKVKKAKKR